MPVTDEQVAALRALLASDADQEEWAERHRKLLQNGRGAGYGELFFAAFVTAVRRRFSPTWTLASVIEFVASVRATLGEERDAVQPRAAENMIRRALGDTITDEFDAETKARAQLLLLIVLIEDEQLDDAALDKFLSDARAKALGFVVRGR